MAKKLRKSQFCSNCNVTLDGDNYCPECGQQNTTNDVDMGILVKDFIDDFFTLDSRLFKTIIPLLFKPGFLTLEYNKGRRVKYLPPLRMYLVLSVLTFLIPKDVNIDDDLELDLGGEIELQETQDSQLSLAGTDFFVDFSKFKTSDTYKDSVIQSMWEGSKEHWLYAVLGEDISKNLFGNSMSLLIHKEARNAFVSSYISKIPNMMFILLPLFALLVALFFRKKNMLYVQTLVFSLHLHSFFFFVLCFKQFLEMVLDLPNLVVLILFAVLPFLYFVLALKNVYQQSLGKVVVKGSVILGLYGMLVGIGLVMIALVLLIFY